MQQPCRILLAVLVVWCLSACAGAGAVEGRPGHHRDGGGRVQYVLANPKHVPDDLCSLLTRSEIEAVLDKPVSKGSMGTLIGPECTWAITANRAFVSLESSSPKSTDPKVFKRWHKWDGFRVEGNAAAFLHSESAHYCSAEALVSEGGSIDVAITDPELPADMVCGLARKLLVKAAAGLAPG